MTVKELIEQLKECNLDMEVVIEYDGDYYKVNDIQQSFVGYSNYSYSTKDLIGGFAVVITHDIRE